MMLSYAAEYSRTFIYSKELLPDLNQSDMKVNIHEKVPCNDAGISLGQAYIIRESLKTGMRSDYGKHN